ncbi:hypothetical protein MSPP1_002258 [Malassezia sp. CBS 17886]|nr:hypothetical protein MSPP1_002258 [Malassezia sp. CBS 17886]
MSLSGSGAKDAPDLGECAAPPAHGDEELFAELEHEVEALNDADVDDAAQVAGGSGRGADGDLADAFQEYRARRLAELQATAAAQQGGVIGDPDRGKYREVRDEKELLHTSAVEPRCVIHFSHPEFRRCQILDRHLDHLARQHPGTLFVKTDVRNTPFLVEKLGIQVLPCLMAFENGTSKDRLVGFEEFGNADTFSTAALEWRLGRAGVLAPQQAPTDPILGFGAAAAARDGDDDDWD